MKRYCVDREPNCTCRMCGDPEGSWVKYNDARALQKQLDELKAHNDQLQSLLSTQEVSLNKIKADAVREFFKVFRTSDGYLDCSVTQAEQYANQLEGKE